MTHERERLAALTMEDDLPVHSALHISYSALPTDAARMYRLMGLFPGTHFDSAVAARWRRAAAAAVPRARAKQASGSGGYRGSSLTRCGRCSSTGGGTPSGLNSTASGFMREIGSARGEAEGLLSLGDLAFHAGDPDQARTRYAEAQRLLISLGSLDEARVRMRLARLDPPGQH